MLHESSKRRHVCDVYFKLNSTNAPVSFVWKRHNQLGNVSRNTSFRLLTRCLPSPGAFGSGAQRHRCDRPDGRPRPRLPAAVRAGERLTPATRWRRTPPPVNKSCPFLPLQAARLQNSVVFGAARELDFGKDPVGSLGQLICDRDPSSSANASASARSAGPMGIIGVAAGNSSGAFTIMFIGHVTNFNAPPLPTCGATSISLACYCGLHQVVWGFRM